jgi:hypothetical protein
MAQITQLEQDYKNAKICLATSRELLRVFNKISHNRQVLVKDSLNSLYKVKNKMNELVQLLEDVQDIGWELTNDIVVDED